MGDCGASHLRGVGVAAGVGARRDDDDSLVAVWDALHDPYTGPGLVADLLHYRASLADHAAHLRRGVPEILSHLSV